MKGGTWQVGLRLILILNGPSFANHPLLCRLIPASSYPTVWFSLLQPVLLPYSFSPQISHPISIWKSFSSPRQDLSEQCCQILRLFTSTACSDLQERLCESCDCSCWRQAAAGLAACRSSKEKGVTFGFISCDFLVCFATFLSLIFVAGFFSPPWYCPIVKAFWFVCPVGWSP